MNPLLDALTEAGRQAGLTARHAISGVGGMASAFANPLALALNEGLELAGSDYRFPDQYAALQRAMTEAGLPEPQGALERGIGFASEIGVPDPTDSAKVVSSLSHMIDPEMAMALIRRELRPDDVATGAPVEFTYGRNTQGAPDMGPRFGQDIEPSGRYMSSIGEKNRLDVPGMEYGEHKFDNPLVIDFGGGYEEATNWKRVLSDRYGGLTGKKLSEAIKEDGYDGIITISAMHSRPDEKYVSEIVDLTHLGRKGEAIK